MTTTFQGPSSLDLDRRAEKALPRGLAGHLSPQVNFPGAPHFIARAEGSRFWDVDGNEYIDMMCSWGPIVVGHLNPEVEEAVARQHAMVDCGNGAPPVMVDLAEKLVWLVDDGAWSLFAKNGSDVTTLAVTLARAETGRRTVLIADGAYHGALPWCNPDTQGVLPGDREGIDTFEFNDLESVAAAAAAHESRSCARSRAAAPSRARSAMSPSSRVTAARSAPTSPGATSSPVTPSSTRSRRPPTALATTGRPCAIASITAIP